MLPLATSLTNSGRKNYFKKLRVLEKWRTRKILKLRWKKATTEQQTGKKLPRLHTMTKLTNLTMNKLTTIMKPPGQNRVSTMKETLTEPSQL